MLFILDSNNQITQLKKDLQSFGLNPIDWNVLKENSRTYKVQSKQDKSFIFRGKASRKGLQLKWKKLELESL